MHRVANHRPILPVYEPLAMQFLLGGTVPKLWVGVELGGRVWYRAKVLRIRSNLFAGTETLSLSVNEPIARQILSGGTVPQFGEGVELEGHVWHPVKVLRIRSNLFNGTEMISLSVYETIAKEVLHGGNRPPIWGR